MSAVSERTLNWLYSVLTNDYHDVNRAYSDVAATLSHYSSLKPRTEEYIFENGVPALLLLLSGTLPVSFRGATYRFPLQIWIPHEYPYQAPILYITPAQDMVLVPGNHVGNEGRIYHRYLAQWSEYWDRSSLLDFLDILRAVFAKEAPVRAAQKLPIQSPPQPSRATPPAPPVPPPPEEWRRAQQPQLPPYRTSEPHAGPPPLPPKPGDHATNEPPRPGAFEQQRKPEDGPPLPPLPPEASSGGRREPQQWHQAGSPFPPEQHRPLSLSTPQRQSSLGRDPQSMPPHIRPYMTQQAGNRTSQYGSDGPVSPVSPDATHGYQQRAQAPQLQYAPQQQQQHPPQQHPHVYQQGGAYGAQQVQGSLQNHPPQQNFRQGLQPSKPKAPTLDLLTSPLEVTLPSQDPANNPSLSAPPIPPNPEKDMLLSTLATALNGQIHQTLQSNATATESLQAQQTALQASHARLQSELSHLSTLDAAIDTNTRILHETMREADRVMSDAKHRTRPEVDAVLVAPTVVATQLYREAGEVEGLTETRAVLGRGLEAGVVGAGEYVKMLRATAREEFHKKALVRKIGRGLGLEEFDRLG